MKKPTKLKPRTLDITFCDLATSACEKCDTCARNLRRYAIRNWSRVSLFSVPLFGFTASECAYYIEDARKPEE